jgi:5-oxopent-3-ene-1,2,5-tricarboxylate decarboxylase/2-hydroxyhepta-2,4-diene-1,7-dioate isomerase
LNFMPQGTVYGTLLNFQSEVTHWTARMTEAPYKAPPKAPVLYIKPANTWSASGATIPVPARVPEVEVGATIAMVMGAGGVVAGYVLMNDLSVPHTSFFRPPVKFKCLDGFLGVGSQVLPAAEAVDAASFQAGSSPQWRLGADARLQPVGAPCGSTAGRCG